MRISTVMLSLTCLIGCRSPQQQELSGRLVYTNGGGEIRELELKTGHSSVLYEKKGVSIDTISRTEQNRLIFGECALDAPCMIKEQDLATKGSRSLGVGAMPTYVGKWNTIFYYRREEGQERLFAAEISQLDRGKEIAKAPSPLTTNKGNTTRITSPVVSVSDDQVVFVGEDRHLWIYDLSVSQLRRTGIDGKNPVAWRSRRKLLICHNLNFDGWYQLDLNSMQATTLPEVQTGIVDLVYIEKYDAVVFLTTSWVPDQYNLVMYYFGTGKQTELQPKTYLRSGVWLE